MNKINLIKVLSLGAIGVFATIACEKTEINNNKTDYEYSEEISAKQKFSRALSEAVYTNTELRTFIKEEAELQFDKDNDVFYPFVKDCKVKDDKTFREYLLDYINEDELSSIESELPLLNILVPDWSWLGAFGVDNWDISDEAISVSTDETYGSEHILYHNGEKIGSLRIGEFPDFPVLIVKENERMKLVEGKTKASLPDYDFVDEAFRNTKTKVAPRISYIDLPTNPGTTFIPKSEQNLKLFDDAIKGWKEYGLDQYEAQRQYVYYNMRKGDTMAALKPKMREAIIAFKLNYVDAAMDSNEDPKLQKPERKKSDFKSNEEILEKLWSAGQLEIQFHVTTVYDNELITLCDNSIPVNPDELFDISKLERQYIHKTMMNRNKYTYIPDSKNLVPKWYYIPEPLKLESWNPGRSTIYNVHIYELDKNYDVTVKETVKSQKGISLNAGIGNKFKFEFNADSKITTTEFSYVMKKESNNLGQKEVMFFDEIIKSETPDSFELNSYTTGKAGFIVATVRN